MDGVVSSVYFVRDMTRRRFDGPRTECPVRNRSVPAGIWPDFPDPTGIQPGTNPCTGTGYGFSYGSKLKIGPEPVESCQVSFEPPGRCKCPALIIFLSKYLLWNFVVALPAPSLLLNLAAIPSNDSHFVAFVFGRAFRNGISPIPSGLLQVRASLFSLGSWSSMGNKPGKQEREVVSPLARGRQEILLKVAPPLDHAHLRWLARDLERVHGFTPGNCRAVTPPDHYAEYMRLQGWLDVNLDDPDLSHLFPETPNGTRNVSDNQICRPGSALSMEVTVNSRQGFLSNWVDEAVWEGGTPAVSLGVKNAGTSQSTELAKPPISSLHFITRSHSSTPQFLPPPITSTCAVPLDPQPTSNDHTSLFQSRVHDLLRRGLLSSAQQAIQRFIASSPTVPDAVFAIEFAAASGVDLGLGISCEILRKLLGKFDDAVKLFDRLIGSEDCVLSNAACTMILEGFYEQDKFLEAFDYFVRISDANVKLGMWIYNVLINGLCHQGYVGEAIQVFDIKCKNTGLPPTLHKFKTLFFGLCKKGWLVEAELVFEEMEVQGFFVDKMGLFDKAWVLWNLMSDLGIQPNEVTYNLMIWYYCKQGKLDCAFDYFVRISDPNVKLGMWIYNVLINGLCHQGYVGEAIQVFDIMCKNTGLPPTRHMFKTLFFGLCKKGWLVEAELVFEEMEVQGFFVDKVMYTSLMNAHGKNKKMKMAMRVYFRMLKKGCDPDICTYNTLIHGFLKMGLYDKAWVLWNLMSDLGIQPNEVTYNLMICYYCKQGKLDCATMLLNSMVPCNLAPCVHCYTPIIAALYKQNRCLEVDEMCERMLESGIIPDHVLFFVLMKNEPKGLELQLCLLMLQAIAKTVWLDHSSLSNFDKINSSAGLEQEIELILREITRIDLNLCNVAGSIYVSALCEGGKTEAALACFKNVASAGCIPLLFTFNSLIKRLFQDGRFEDVKSLFEIMQNEGIVPNLETYLIMVKEYCKQEDLASAFGILDQMKEMGPEPNVAIYACIIACLSKQRRISEECFTVAYMTMIKAYTRNGRGDKALNLFEKMIENAIQPSSYSYTALLSGLVKRKIRLKNLVDLMARSKIKADLVLHIAWISCVCGNITGTKKRWHMTSRISKRARDLLFNLLHQKAS
uniref:Pentatricopeptide repeat-containing protein n=1 Tax=Salix viminalis TaxID=40686 RepID=A0A6N2M810_SALVM